MKSHQLVKIILNSIRKNIFIPKNKYQQRKLKNLLQHAKLNSKFYEELYKDIDINQITPFNLSILPPVTKAQVIENYDDILCCDVTKKEVLNFSTNLNNLHTLLQNKYVICTTSGTTGEKLKTICTNDEFNYMMSMGALYTWPKKQYALDILTSNRPLVYIIPTDNFYASTQIANTYLGLSRNNQSEIIDFRVPIDELVEKLNKINPILIGGYVSSFLLLAEKANEGELNIDVKYMVSIGSTYVQHDRDIIKNSFNCETFTSYSCTEAGEIGCECTEGHYHINPDTIIEAADECMNPVNDNEEADCLLVTNLWNTTMPLIRYRLNDRCIVHSEQCSCGRKGKWIEVLGRKVMHIPFINNDNNTVIFTDFMLEYILNDNCDGYNNHQLYIKDNTIEVRLNLKNDIEKYTQFNAIKQRFDKLAKANNTTLNVVLSKDMPIIEDSGKFKRIII